MATFQLRVVGTYFGSMFTGPVKVEIEGETAPSVKAVMDKIKLMSSAGKIKNCVLFNYTSVHYDTDRGNEENLYYVYSEYTKDPISRAEGTGIRYLLKENLNGAGYEQVLQYYLYEVPHPNDPNAPIMQLNRVGDRVSFSDPISKIRNVEYKPSGHYYIIWRMVTIATGSTSSTKLNARLDRIAKGLKKS